MQHVKDGEILLQLYFSLKRNNIFNLIIRKKQQPRAIIQAQKPMIIILKGTKLSECFDLFFGSSSTLINNIKISH